MSSEYTSDISNNSIIEKYFDLSKVYSGKELIDRIVEFVIERKKYLNSSKNLSGLKGGFYNCCGGDINISDNDMKYDYYFVGDVENGITKVRSLFVDGNEYLIDKDNRVYNASSLDDYGLLLQIGIFNKYDGSITYVKPELV